MTTGFTNLVGVLASFLKVKAGGLLVTAKVKNCIEQSHIQ